MGVTVPGVKNSELLLPSLGLVISDHLEAYFAAHEGLLPSNGLYDRIIREVEKPLILITLAAAQGNQARAAKILGIHRNTLRKKMQQLALNLEKRKI